MSKLGILHNEFSITYRRNFELKTFKITILVLFSAACSAPEKRADYTKSGNALARKRPLPLHLRIKRNKIRAAQQRFLASTRWKISDLLLLHPERRPK
jgi:hypothetical protein